MELRKGDLVPPALRRYATAVPSQYTATVFPKRDDWKWRRPRRTASSSLALIGRRDSFPEAGSDERTQMRSPTRHLRHLTRSRGRETPGGERPLGTDEAGEATTADPEGSPGTKPQEPTGLTDPKTGEGKFGETSCAACPLELGGPLRKASPREKARHWQEARRRTEILRLLTEAWIRDLAMEKPQKTGY